MIVWLNGSFVPEDQAVVSVFDRGFLLGDGLFDTIRLCSGRAFRLSDHLERFEAGARHLQIQPPIRNADIEGILSSLVEQNAMPDCLARITLSRGRGPRGYSPRLATTPTLVISLHALPEKPDQLRAIQVITSSLAATDHFSRMKANSRLLQVMAKGEADAAGADDAILPDRSGNVAEATSSNVFWIENEVVCTAPLSGPVLPGVTRKVILELCRREGLPFKETNISVQALRKTSGVFLTVSSLGVVEVISLDGQALARSELVPRLHQLLMEEMRTGAA